MSTEDRNTKGRNWMVTLNNPTAEEREFYQNFQLGDHFNYFVYQEEKGESGTVHFQGYLECRQQIKKSWLIIHFSPRADYRLRRGTQEEAIAYCKKEETRVEGGQSGEFGQPKAGAGGCKRDREAAIEVLTKIQRMEMKPSEIDAATLMIPGFCSAQKLCLSNMGNGPDRSEKFRIFVVNGPTGVGKSFAFHKICAGGYTSYQSGWFVNAEQLNEYLFLDEFVGGCKDGMQLHELLSALDPYPQRVPIKGGFAPAVYTTVFITTNISPDQWYSAIGPNGEEIKKRKENLNALYDRIGFIPSNPGENFQRIRTNGHYLDLWEDDPENPLFLGGRIHESVDQKRDRLRRWMESFGFKY